jgi:hypothetical protein
MQRRNTFYVPIMNSEVQFSLCAVCVVTGVRVTCNNVLCLHLSIEHVHATRTFNAAVCVLTFFWRLYFILLCLV